MKSVSRKRRASKTKTRSDKPPTPMWTDFTREKLGFSNDFPSGETLSNARINDLLLFAASDRGTDDPVSDLLIAVAEELESLVWFIKRESDAEEENADSRPRPEMLEAIARKARVAKTLHVRVGEILHQEIRRLGAG